MLEWFLRKTKSGDYVINACNTSSDKAWTGWLQRWMQRTRQTEKPFCSVVDCNKIATVGAHVRIIRGSQEFASIYVIPMCHGCNNRQGKKSEPPPRMAVHKNILLLETNLHNLCRYRCRHYCQYKVKRKRRWLRFLKIFLK
ncbi:hypothetical protein PVA44_05025 [Entomospira nematocerorum]|uniref:Uncharacterized protein n=1 Tax=Entomospira nematocerorum TaxID=2719987 RepID=A0A968GF37_9SPIO|nr:hypothetical protein [Entomospira nematocera]NIZ46616.1 hypothetical protein [Entomospira nematocera]WDI33586.1 hypothetical protein PVA44_05025 [Entomospira nematocera]